MSYFLRKHGTAFYSRYKEEGFIPRTEGDLCTLLNYIVSKYHKTYSYEERVKEAEELFRTIKKPEPWQWKSFLLMLTRVSKTRPECINLDILDCALDYFSDNVQHCDAERAHQSIFDILCRTKSIDRAVGILVDMKRRNYLSKKHLKRVGMLVNLHAQIGGAKSLQTFLANMISSDVVTPRLEYYYKLILQYEREEANEDMILSVLDEALRMTRPSVDAGEVGFNNYTRLTDFFIEHGFLHCLSRVLEYFDTIALEKIPVVSASGNTGHDEIMMMVEEAEKNQHVEPREKDRSIRRYEHAISKLSAKGNTIGVEHIYLTLLRSILNGTPTRQVFESMLEAYRIVGDTKGAENVWTRMDAYKYSCDIFFYSTLLQTYLQSGDIQGAKPWITRLENDGQFKLKNRKKVFVAVLRGCAKCGSTEGAEYVADLILDFRIDEDVSYLIHGIVTALESCLSGHIKSRNISEARSKLSEFFDEVDGSSKMSKLYESGARERESTFDGFFRRLLRECAAKGTTDIAEMLLLQLPDKGDDTRIEWYDRREAFRWLFETYVRNEDLQGAENVLIRVKQEAISDIDIDKFRHLFGALFMELFGKYAVRGDVDGAERMAQADPSLIGHFARKLSIDFIEGHDSTIGARIHRCSSSSHTTQDGLKTHPLQVEWMINEMVEERKDPRLDTVSDRRREEIADAFITEIEDIDKTNLMLCRDLDDEKEFRQAVLKRFDWFPKRMSLIVSGVTRYVRIRNRRRSPYVSSKSTLKQVMELFRRPDLFVEKGSNWTPDGWEQETIRLNRRCLIASVDFCMKQIPHDTKDRFLKLATLARCVPITLRILAHLWNMDLQDRKRRQQCIQFAMELVSLGLLDKYDRTQRKRKVFYKILYHIPRWSFDWIYENTPEQERDQLGVWTEQKLSHIFGEGLSEALSSKLLPWSYSRLMLIGDGKAGKTSVLRSLMSIDFNEEHDSTVGASIVRVNANTKWRKVSSSHTTACLARCVLTSTKNCNSRKPKAHKSRASKSRSKKSGKTKETTMFKRTKSVAKSSSKFREEGIEKTSFDTQNDDATFSPPKIDGNTTIEASESKDTDEREEAPQNIGALVFESMNKNGDSSTVEVCVWDFGGQDVFASLRQLFFTRFGVYLLVFDMEKMLPLISTMTWNGHPARIVDGGRKGEDGTLYWTIEITKNKDDNPSHRTERRRITDWKDFEYQNDGYKTPEDRLMAHLEASHAIDQIANWMKSVILHAPGAPVVIVGTRKDNVGDSHVHAKISDLLEMVVQNVLPANHVIPSSIEGRNKKSEPRIRVFENVSSWVVKNDLDNALTKPLCFFPVDNRRSNTSQEDETIQYLREFIPKIIREDPERYILEETPKSWLDLASKIQPRGLQNDDEPTSDSLRDVMKYEEFCELASKFHIYSEEEVNIMLEYLHKFGIVVYFSDDEKMKGWVILNPQWIVDSIADINRDLNMHKRRQNEATLFEKQDYQRFKDTGLIKGSLLEKFWKSDGDVLTIAVSAAGGASKNEDDADDFVSNRTPRMRRTDIFDEFLIPFMKRFGFLCECNDAEYSATKEYFVPGRLKKIDDLKFSATFSKYQPSLVIDFRQSFFPNDFFGRLLARLSGRRSRSDVEHILFWDATKLCIDVSEKKNKSKQTAEIFLWTRGCHDQIHVRISSSHLRAIDALRECVTFCCETFYHGRLVQPTYYACLPVEGKPESEPPLYSLKDVLYKLWMAKDPKQDCIEAVNCKMRSPLAAFEGKFVPKRRREAASVATIVREKVETKLDTGTASKESSCKFRGGKNNPTISNSTSSSAAADSASSKIQDAPSIDVYATKYIRMVSTNERRRIVHRKSKIFASIFPVRATGGDDENVGIQCVLKETREEYRHIALSLGKKGAGVEYYPKQDDFDTLCFNRDTFNDMLERGPRVLHFIGHGNRGSLVFDKWGKNAPYSRLVVEGVVKEPDEFIVGLIELNVSLELVFLNCCLSSNLGEKLAKLVPYVICWRGRDGTSLEGGGEIKSKESLHFAEAFYNALSTSIKHGGAENVNIETAFRKALIMAKTHSERACNIETWRPLLFINPSLRPPRPVEEGDLTKKERYGNFVKEHKEAMRVQCRQMDDSKTASKEEESKDETKLKWESAREEEVANWLSKKSPKLSQYAPYLCKYGFDSVEAICDAPPELFQKVFENGIVLPGHEGQIKAHRAKHVEGKVTRPAFVRVASSASTDSVSSSVSQSSSQGHAYLTSNESDAVALLIQLTKLLERVNTIDKLDKIAERVEVEKKNMPNVFKFSEKVKSANSEFYAAHQTRKLEIELGV